MDTMSPVAVELSLEQQVVGIMAESRERFAAWKDEAESTNALLVTENARIDEGITAVIGRLLTSNGDVLDTPLDDLAAEIGVTDQGKLAFQSHMIGVLARRYEQLQNGRVSELLADKTVHAQISGLGRFTVVQWSGAISAIDGHNEVHSKFGRSKVAQGSIWLDHSYKASGRDYHSRRGDLYVEVPLVGPAAQNVHILGIS